MLSVKWQLYCLHSINVSIPTISLCPHYAGVHVACVNYVSVRQVFFPVRAACIPPNGEFLPSLCHGPRPHGWLLSTRLWWLVVRGWLSAHRTQPQPESATSHLLQLPLNTHTTLMLADVLFEKSIFLMISPVSLTVSAVCVRDWLCTECWPTRDTAQYPWLNARLQ